MAKTKETTAPAEGVATSEDEVIRAKAEAQRIIAEAEAYAAEKKSQVDKALAKAKEQEKTVFIPRDKSISGKEANQVFVSVNFKNYIIETEKRVAVPPAVKEVIDNAQAAAREAVKRAESQVFVDPTQR